MVSDFMDQYMGDHLSQCIVHGGPVVQDRPAEQPDTVRHLPAPLNVTTLRKALPKTWSTPTMSPHAADTEKYDILQRLVDKLVAKGDAGETLAGRAIKEVVTVNGARVILDNGSWGLVRASSNTPNLVVVCESSESEAEMRAIFADIDAVIRTEPGVGDYDQTI